MTVVDILIAYYYLLLLIIATNESIPKKNSKRPENSGLAA
jgi:hypothetical protein